MSTSFGRRRFMECGAAALALTSGLAESFASKGNNAPPAREKGIAIPWIKGTFRHILNPPGMRDARATGLKEQWYINDHCFLVDASERIHWFGITNPYPQNSDLYGPGTHHHIGHAVAYHPFGPWEERAHALALPKGAPENVGASFVLRTGDGFLMVFGYNTGFHFARSSDLNTWQLLAELPVLDLGQGTRDPCVLQLQDGVYLLYGACGHEGRSAVALASSNDLTHWKQEEPALLTDIPVSYGALESPCVYQRENAYYLFVNYSHRQYEETLVFHSNNPRRFDWQSPLCTVFAHAGKVLAWRGMTYISHCGIEDRHWSDVNAPYGLWLAELRWAKPTLLREA